VLRAMTVRDLAIFPGKLLLIGLVVALSSCVTGLGAQEADTPATLLPRGFTRGVTGIMAVTLALSAL
jgi:phospholipid/cholesterol/gamma-HCH transport system permease protein